MELFKGKTRSERNKIIAAIVLGMLAAASLIYAFGPGLFSSSTSASSATSPSPTPSPSPSVTANQFKMPSQSEQEFDYATTPIDYRPATYGAPDPGRNIFAFYEPPPPTPWSPTPYVPPPTPPPPTPTPTPPYLIGFVQPQNVYAGSRGFRLDVNGDMFTPDAKIYFSQSLLPTTFVSPQRLTAEVPANFIAVEGLRQVIVQSVDGTKYSNQVMFSVQAPPKPQHVYIGMIARKFANNDTAYFVEQSKVNAVGTVPIGKRLNDIIEGRFRLVSISASEVILEDVNLGFRHPLKLYQAPAGSSGAPPSGFPTRGFPNLPNNSRPGTIPGFPNTTLPPPQPNNSNRPQRPETEKKDEDGDDDGE